MAPIRVQLSRKKGWKMPPNTVKVDRTTNWGNPYSNRDLGSCDPALLVGLFRDHADTPDWHMRPRLHLLRGKNLACWCSLESPCHAEVLLELANRPVCDDPAARSPEGGT